MDYVATLLRTRGLDDQVIHPHGLGDRRTDPDVGEQSGTGVGDGAVEGDWQRPAGTGLSRVIRTGRFSTSFAAMDPQCNVATP
jgi:hypothetical protein